MVYICNEFNSIKCMPEMSLYIATFAYSSYITYVADKQSNLVFRACIQELHFMIAQVYWNYGDQHSFS